MVLRGKPSHNIAWLTVERIFRVSVGAIVLAFVARHLGAAQFATLNYALLLLALAIPLANLCMDGLVVAELVRHPPATPIILGSAFALRLLGGLAAAALLLIAAATGRLGADWNAVVPVALLLVLQAGEVADLWFQRELLASRTLLPRVLATVFGAGLKLALIQRDAEAIAFVWAQLAESTLYGAALLWSYRRSGQRVSQWRCRPAEMRRLARLAWPLAVAGLLVGAYLRLDQFLVRQWLAPDVTGAYFAATRVVDVATITATAVATSLFPGLAAAHAGDADQFQARLLGVFGVLTGFGWIVALGLTFLAPWIVQLLFGAEFRAAVPILIIKGWTCIVLFSGMARGQFVVLAGATHANLAAVGIGIVLQALAAVWLLPRWGGIGAAVAALLAAIGSGWLTSFLLPTLRPSAGTQTRAMLVAFKPKQWPACLKLLS